MARDMRRGRKIQVQKQQRRKRRRRNRKAGPVMIALLLILLVCLFLIGKMLYEKYSPSKELADVDKYFDLENNQDMAVIMDDVLIEDKARFVNGKVYLHVNTVYQYLNSRFYWDEKENIYLYALPMELVSVEVGSSEYSVAKSKKSEDYVILRADGNDAYVALDFIQKYTKLTYEFWEDPNHVHIISQFSNKKVATVQKKTQIRCEAGIKSPILTTVEKGNTVFVIKEDKDGWFQVLTPNGYIGYVKSNKVSSVSAKQLEEPTFEEPEYTSISKDYPINLAWHQVTTMNANEQLLNRIADVKGLTTISPTWFSIQDTSGNISSFASQEYVNYAHQHGLEVWALVDNFKEGVSTYETLSKTSSRQRLVNQLTAAAIQYELDGINVDFETITEEGGKAFIEFVRELSIMCRINGIVLSVDNYVPTASSDHYARAEQGVFADYVIIMGYDEHYSGSKEAGSVASYSFVENGIQNTLKEVPKEKIINAIPFYTRLWKTDEDGNVSSEAMGMQKADERLASNGAEPLWNEETHQYYAEFEYEGSLYQIWLEEERSIEEKLQLIKKYDLAGVASWKLGFERSNIWDIILKYVN